MKKIIYVAFCHLFIFYITNVFAQVEKIYLNPKAAGNEIQSKFVDSIQFIPITSDEKTNVSIYNNLTIAKKHFILIDYPNSTVYICSKAGKVLKSVNYKKLGSNCYPTYQEVSDKIHFFGGNKNYTLTSRDEIKIQLGKDNPKNRKYFKKYTLDLKDPALLLKKEIPNEHDILNAWNYYKDYYFRARISTSSLYKDSAAYELSIYKNQKLVRSYFPYNRINEPRFLFTQAFVTNTETEEPHIRYVTRPYCDTIYKLVVDSLYPAYHLVLPLENAIPAKFFSTPFKNKADRENFIRNNGWMLHQIYDFYESPKFICMFVAFSSNYERYIYNKQTKLVYNYKNIKADSTFYNLKLFDQINSSRKGDKFYIVKQAEDIINFFKNNARVPVPKELQEFLKTNPSKTTPVIIAYQLKK